MFVKCLNKNRVVNLLQSENFGRNKGNEIIAIFSGKIENKARPEILGSYRSKQLADAAFDELCDALENGDNFFDMPIDPTVYDDV